MHIWSNVLPVAVRLLSAFNYRLACFAPCFQVQKWLVDVVKPQFAADWPGAEPRAGPPRAMRPPAPLLNNGLGKVQHSACVLNILACHCGALPPSMDKAD